MSEVERAKDPGTPPGLLLELAKEGTAEVRRAVASNPNAPWAALRRELLAEYPDVVLTNPVLPLLALENPTLGSDLSPEAMKAVAGSMHLPEHLASRLMQSMDLALLVVLLWNDRFPIPLRRSLFCRVESIQQLQGYTLTADQSVYVDPPFRELLRRVGWVHGGSPAAAPEPGLTETDLEELYRAGARGADLAVEYPYAPPHFLARVARTSPDKDVLARVARHPLTPPEVLEDLAGSPEQAVRKALLVNPRLPAGVVVRLARDRLLPLGLKRALPATQRPRPSSCWPGHSQARCLQQFARCWPSTPRFRPKAPGRWPGTRAPRYGQRSPPGPGWPGTWLSIWPGTRWPRCGSRWPPTPPCPGLSSGCLPGTRT